jgi:kinesin family member 11
LQGFQRSLTSAQVISKTSIDFFRDIRAHVTRLIKLIEQNQIERSSQLVEFEKEFKVVGFITLCYIFNYGQTI